MILGLIVQNVSVDSRQLDLERTKGWTVNLNFSLVLCAEFFYCSLR